jgi:hypothetical protein
MARIRFLVPTNLVIMLRRDVESLPAAHQADGPSDEGAASDAGRIEDAPETCATALGGFRECLLTNQVAGPVPDPP